MSMTGIATGTGERHGLFAARTRTGAPTAARKASELLAPSERVVVLASADTALRHRVAGALRGMRWEVREAAGGAELFAQMDPSLPSAGTVVLDSWLPDLEVRECVRDLALLHPGVDLLSIDGTDFGAAPAQGAYRNEVLYAISRAEDAGSAAWRKGPEDIEARQTAGRAPEPGRKAGEVESALRSAPSLLPELLGTDPRMLEVGRRIRLVAPRSTAVLVQGPTGTGKELVARALHRLSPRVGRPFLAMNCAAIPEALLEAELFGHTRGAFTGAVQGRVGRLEAANGGTLFLDEIGELPLNLQAKLLRFVESGELQRVGENEPVRVDVRLIAATHRSLAKMAAAGTFRADLYYRLSVFLIRTPELAGRREDIQVLAEQSLARMGRSEPAKWLSPEALECLLAHAWPGNVRELEHTLERAWILAEERPVIGVEDLDFGELVEENS